MTPFTKVLPLSILESLGRNNIIQHALYGLAQLRSAVYSRYSTHGSPPKNPGHLFCY